MIHQKVFLPGWCINLLTTDLNACYLKYDMERLSFRKTLASI